MWVTIETENSNDMIAHVGTWVVASNVGRGSWGSNVKESSKLPNSHHTHGINHAHHGENRCVLYDAQARKRFGPGSCTALPISHVDFTECLHLPTQTCETPLAFHPPPIYPRIQRAKQASHTGHSTQTSRARLFPPTPVSVVPPARPVCVGRALQCVWHPIARLLQHARKLARDLAVG